MTRMCSNLCLVAIALMATPADSLRADTIEQISTVRTPVVAYCVRFLPDTSKVAVVDNERVRICDSESGRQVTELSAPNILLTELCINDNGERLVTATYEGSQKLDVSLWNANNGKLISTLRFKKSYSPKTVASISDQKYVVLSSSIEKKDGYSEYHGEAALIDLGAKKVIGIFQTESPPSSMAVSADKKKVVIGEHDGNVSVFDASSMVRERKFNTGARESVKRVYLSNDGNTLVTQTSYKELSLWNMADVSKRGSLRINKEAITAAAISADGKRMAACASDFAAAERRPDGSILVIVKEAELIVWDLETQKEIASIRAHDGAVQCMDFSRDGKMLVTSGDDKQTKVWRIKESK